MCKKGKHDGYLKILLDVHDKALLYIFSFKSIHAEMTSKEYGKILIENNHMIVFPFL